MSALRSALLASGLPTMPYSGRGMYGRQCLAVRISRESGIADLLVAIIDEVNDGNREGLATEVVGAQTDSLGLDSVLYFPNVAASGSEDA